MDPRMDLGKVVNGLVQMIVDRFPLLLGEGCRCGMVNQEPVGFPEVFLGLEHEACPVIH